MRDLFCRGSPFSGCSRANRAARRPVFFLYGFHTSLFKRSNRLVPKCTWKRANSAPILHHSDLLLSRHTRRQTRAHLFTNAVKTRRPKWCVFYDTVALKKVWLPWMSTQSNAVWSLLNVQIFLGGGERSFWHFDKVLFKPSTR